MRRILLSLLLLAALGPAGVFAASPQAPTLTAADTEAAEGLERLRQTSDIEQKIALGEQLLAAPTNPAPDVQGVPRGSIRAQIEFELGSAYLARQRGEHADNQEQAIAHLQAALSGWEKDTGSLDWAHAHNNLAIAYTNRIRGEKADNIEVAISHLEAAEPVLAKLSPQEWGQLQNNFAVVYLGRLTGDHSENMEAAIKHLEAALTVLSKDADPYRWAMLQHNLAASYTARKAGTRIENQRNAMAHIEAALQVFTRDAYPNEWAQSQHNLGIAYHERIEGDPGDNQDQALQHFEEALTVFGRESVPEQWAQLQQNIGIAYSGRTKDSQAENRRKAIAAFEAALTVFTRDGYPQDHMRTARLLGGVLLRAGELKKASLAQDDARAAFLVLLGQGPDEAEARSLIADAGPLFAESAFTAAQLGDGERALTIANEGRGRLLTLAMRQQTLKLGEAEQRRLEELREAIRTARTTVGTTHGDDRIKALAQLAGSRQELLQLVQGAGDDAQIAMNEARAIVSGGGSVAVPVVTGQGGKLLVMTQGGFVSIIDLPELTTARLQKVLIGADGGDVPTGWLGAYFVNYLTGEDMQKRWPEWLGAIDGLGPELWRLVGAPLDAVLKQRGTAPGARLVWLPSGWLGTLPLGLAQDPASKRRLMDDYEIVYAPNLEALAASEEAIAAASAPTLTAIVNPTGDLPGTEKEGAIVAAHFQPAARTVLHGEAATPAAVLDALKGHTHWHFASHGGFSWLNPRQSGLLLHGPAKLTVGELADAEGLGHPRLVVLSACETGLYDLTNSPDEFIGLPATFISLGAAGVLGTLWPVSDAATALLIGKFYELHIENGQSPPTALHGAQLWLREATTDELEGFAKVASARGFLPSRHLTEIEDALNGKGAEHSRSLAGSETGAVTGSIATQRPYAHPYFWAGFIYTGL
jgi:CHAT domain-containing protein/tetratricopeptide (TPR) repeat protein